MKNITEYHNTTDFIREKIRTYFLDEANDIDIAFKNFYLKIKNSQFGFENEFMKIHYINNTTFKNLIKLSKKFGENKVPIPTTRDIYITGKAIRHAIRDVKQKRGAILPDEFWFKLPTIIKDAKTYFDLKNKTLIYAFDLKVFDLSGKFVVAINYLAKVIDANKERHKLNANFIITAGVVYVNNLKEYEKLDA